MRLVIAVKSITLSLLTTACATQTAVESQEKPAYQEAAPNQAGGTSEGAVSASTCQQLSSGLFSRTTISLGSRDESICNLLLSTSPQSKALLIYLTSPTCISCKDGLREIEAQLRSTPGIKLIVAVPTRLDQFIETYSMSDISAFVSPLAPSAGLATDPNGNTWLALSQNRSMPSFPTAVLLGRQTSSFKIYQTANLDKIPTLRSGLLADMVQIHGN
jgi:hypothetical protein